MAKHAQKERMYANMTGMHSSLLPHAALVLQNQVHPSTTFRETLSGHKELLRSQRQLSTCQEPSDDFRTRRSGLAQNPMDRYKALQWIGGGSFGQVRLH